jgi:hypothetical protein
MSANYLRSSEVEVDEGSEHLARYQFGDKDMNHFFCRTCGIAPFSTVASLPPGYSGQAKVGDYRINLGCVADLDVLSLPIEIMDGRAL